MSERLVITVEKDGTPIATLFYRWGGYTVLAFKETLNLLNAIKKDRDQDTRLACIRYAEQTGGCLDGGEEGEEYEKVQKMYPNLEFAKKTTHRGAALVGVTEEAIDEMLDCGEYFVTIDMSARRIYTSELCNWFRNRRSLESAIGTYIDPNSISEMECDPEDMGFLQLRKAVEFFESKEDETYFESYGDFFTVRKVPC